MGVAWGGHVGGRGAGALKQVGEPSVPNVLKHRTQPRTRPQRADAVHDFASQDTDEDARELEVLWVVADHAGAGALTVRFATSTETTARVTTFRSAPDAPGFPAELSTTPQKVHTVSIPTGMEDFGVEVLVTDGAGRKATAVLELGSIVGKQYWARAAGAAPALAIRGCGRQRPGRTCGARASRTSRAGRTCSRSAPAARPQKPARGSWWERSRTT